MAKSQVIKFEVKRRTFEGKTDPSKNDEALTSKYMTSYRYIALYRIRFEYEHGGVSEVDTSRCFRTKREAEESMKQQSKPHVTYI